MIDYAYWLQFGKVVIGQAKFMARRNRAPKGKIHKNKDDNTHNKQRAYKSWMNVRVIVTKKLE